MIIPYSENIECSALICALHSLTNQYKYKAYIVKQFPRLVKYSEEKYTITQMYRSAKNEYKSVNMVLLIFILYTIIKEHWNYSWYICRIII